MEESLADEGYEANLQDYIDHSLIKPARPITFICDLNSRDNILDKTRISLRELSQKLHSIIEVLEKSEKDISGLKQKIGNILLKYNKRSDVRCFLTQDDIRFWNRKKYENTISSDIFPCGITSEIITDLNPGEKFVFGSNLQGMHAGGAARAAVKYFGAIMGQGVGLQGDSYAIPTMHGGVETIRPYVDEFIEFAKTHPQMHFLVTKIGCGIAGFRVSQIAPLFTKALMLSNVSLPKEFIEEIALRPVMPEHTRKKVYGQTRTLVDIACEMNKEKHFASPQEVVEALNTFMEGLRDRGDEIAWTCSFRCVNAFAEQSFVDGKFDINKLQALIDAPNDLDDSSIANIYRHYAAEKTIKMVELLNEFRRYTNPEDLKKDLFSVIDVSHCSPNRPDYYFSFGSPFRPYLEFFFCQYLERFWGEISSDGVLDNAKFKDFMYERHARGVEKYGLKRVIRRNFEQDSPCHPEVYVAYRGGAAPICCTYICRGMVLRQT